MDIVNIKNLGKTFDNKKVLNQINLTLKANEILGFIGRNGAGKSTLINIITGIMAQSYGSYNIMNNNIEDAKKYIGVMSDASDLYSSMKIKNFLKYMGNLKSLKLNNTDVKNLMNKVNLKCSENKKIKDLSFGMKKKLNLAQALLGDPKLLILDEPTSGIDPESAIIIKHLILKLKEEGKTIFFTSHNLDEVERICDRVAILKQGEIIDIGTIQELKIKYTNTIKVIVKTNFNYNKDINLDSIFENYSIKDEYITFEVKSEKEISKKLLFLLSNDLDIYTVKQEKVSLEEIFLNI